MVRLSFSFPWLMFAGALLVCGSGLDCAMAQGPGGFAGDHSEPVYQRRGFDSHDWRGGGKRHRQQNSFYFNAPAVSSGWFQRPYPYHLDYYRMKYGGSYAPYFGNLYGPPQVVTAPPYYGPYYGGYDDAAPYGFNAPVPFDQPAAGNFPYAGDAVADEPVAEDPLGDPAGAGDDEDVPAASP